MNQKGFAPILIILVAAALISVAGGAYYLSTRSKSVSLPTPTIQPSSTLIPTSSPESTSSAETANWKTDTDKRGFSFKYPSNWGNSYDYCSTPPRPNVYELDRNCIRTVIFTTDLPDENDPGGRDLVIISSTKITVAGYEAKRVIYSLPGLNIPDTYTVWLYKNNKPFMLWLSWIGTETSKKQAEEFVQTFNQMLSTFKFINPTPFASCKPKPACLDATPRCLPPEPASGWCP